MNADDFARRVRVKLDGSPLLLAGEDADLMARCGVHYTPYSPVLFDAAAVDDIPAISDVLNRNYGDAVRVYLPHVEPPKNNITS